MNNSSDNFCLCFNFESSHLHICINYVRKIMNHIYLNDLSFGSFKKRESK